MNQRIRRVSLTKSRRNCQDIRKLTRSLLQLLNMFPLKLQFPMKEMPRRRRDYSRRSRRSYLGTTPRLKKRRRKKRRVLPSRAAGSILVFYRTVMMMLDVWLVWLCPSTVFLPF
uniref:Uncharacterized protein n=1 Tax=Populus trichocarpa TaxID=3694 RepID=A9PAZ5_POPTR|nr:unknown [Populus trichocarpa]